MTGAAWAAACALLVPAAAGAAGAWRSYVRPAAFADLLAEADTVWCATREAGLIRYTPSSRTFVSYLREPNGLASNRLAAITLDHSRRLWVATRGSGASVLSANRASWQLVNAFDGLPSDSVNVLTAHGDSLWIGTTRGLALWDGRQIAGVLPDGVNPSPFASNNITGVVEQGDTLWVATLEGVYVGLLSQRLSTWSLVATGLPSSRVDALATDGTTPFALASFAAHRWDPVARRWTLVGGIGAVRTLQSDRATVFAGSGGGLHRWSGTAWTVLDATLRSDVESPFVLTADDTGRVVAAGRPSTAADVSQTGIYRQPDAAGAWRFDFPPGPPGNDCLNLDIDGGRVYVTTYGQGVGRLAGEAWTYWLPGPVGDTSSTQLRRPLFVYAMLVDESGYKWFYSWAPIRYTPTGCVTDTGTVDIMDDSGPTDVVRHQLLGPAPAEARRSFGRASTVDADGGRWFGLDSPCGDQVDLAAVGLEYYKPDSSYGGNFNSGNLPGGNLHSDQVRALVTDKHGRVWAGTSRGISYFDSLEPVTGRPVMEFLPNTDQYVVRGLAVFGDSLWAVTTSEVRRYSVTSLGFHGSYTVPAGPSSQAVRPADLGRDGTLWLGTVNGVRAYHPGGTVNDFHTGNSPIVDDDVRSVRVDRSSGLVWIATAGGVSRFDPGYVPPPPTQDALNLDVYPNPARLTAVGTPIRLRGNGTSYRGEIFDLAGRCVHRFSVPDNDRVVWDGLDAHGDPVWPGIYFMRVESGGQKAFQRLALVR